MIYHRSNIEIGSRVRVVHETGIIERGNVFSIGTDPISKIRHLQIRFDGDTYFTVPEFRADLDDAELRVHDWAITHLLTEPNVVSATLVNTGGGVLSIEVKTDDERIYLVGFTRRATGEPISEAWTADLDPNNDDAWSSGPTAIAAYRAERTADVEFRGGPLDREGAKTCVLDCGEIVPAGGEDEHRRTHENFGPCPGGCGREVVCAPDLPLGLCSVCAQQRRHEPTEDCSGWPLGLGGVTCVECGARLCRCESGFGHDCEG